jgi:hypothetical protein
MLALPLLIMGLLTAYVSTRYTRSAARLELIAGFSVIGGLATLGFCMPLFR